MTTREACYVALFNQLAAGLGSTLVTIDRKLKSLDELSPAQLPALYMVVADQTVTQKHGTPPRRVLEADIYLYAANPDPHVTADTVLNGLIDATQNCLAPAPGFAVQTLGRVVEHCWIAGKIAVYAAPKGQRAAALVPVQMMMP